MADPGNREVRALFRAYKRAASRLRDVLGEPAESLALNFTLKANRGEPTTSSFTAGRAVFRHAALLRPFMADGSELELRRVWAILQGTGLASADRIADVAKAFEDADQLAISVVIDGQQLTARDIYFAYGEGEFFAADPDARDRLAKISIGPMQALVPMTFHDACARYASLALLILEVLLDIEHAIPDVDSVDDDVHQCIYCSATEGDFSPEEHVIPESLIGDAAVIKGSVCAKCNNALSQLDSALIDFEPIALLRVVYGPLTKKGKFPRAVTRDIDLERTAPRHIRITAKSNAGRVEPVEQEDGSYRFSLRATGRKRFDPVPIARALFKIGLGLIAQDAGAHTALDSRYDAARAFIANGTPIESHLLLLTSGQPAASVQTRWQQFDSATLVSLNIYGVVFAFDLESLASSYGEDIPGIARFWLGKSDAVP